MYIRSFAMTLLLAVAGHAFAQEPYPVRAVRIVIPYPPGGGTDLQGRPMAQKLSEKWGQNAVIDNRGGAGGMVGAEIVAKSKPDGYTILMCASGEVSLSVALFPKMPYDPERDLVPVTLLSISPLVLVVHPSLPARSAREFIALAKGRPGEIAYASSGAGGPHHIAGEWMKLITKINIIHVPYKGGGPQLADVIGGHVHSGFIALPVVAPHVKSGRIRVLAVTTAKRSQTLPNVPSLNESGVTGLDVAQWWGVMVPAGTPAAIIARLNTDFVALTKLPDIRARMAELGAEPIGSTAAQLGETIRSDIAKYRKVVKEANISIN